jgi:hypothetical protein
MEGFIASGFAQSSCNRRNFDIFKMMTIIINLLFVKIKR